MDTFVVRLWTPGSCDEAAPSGVHGTVQHVASGRASPFRSGEQLLSLLEALPGSVDTRGGAAKEPSTTRPDVPGRPG